MRNQSQADTVSLTYDGEAPVARIPPSPPDAQGISILPTLRCHMLGTLGAAYLGCRARQEGLETSSSKQKKTSQVGSVGFRSTADDCLEG